MEQIQFMWLILVKVQEVKKGHAFSIPCVFCLNDLGSHALRSQNGGNLNQPVTR